MIQATVPGNEKSRLKVLKRYNLRSPQLQKQFSAVIKILSKSIKVPIVYISTIDVNTQDIQASCGIDLKQTERKVSFCGHTILKDEPMIIEDTLADDRFLDNPLVLKDPKIRFYAGYPLEIEKGQSIGSLCIADTKPVSYTHLTLPTICSV